MKRTLAGRLERLERRMGIDREPFRMCIEYVDRDRKVVSTLMIGPEGEEWWYAPGHSPQDEVTQRATRGAA